MMQFVSLDVYSILIPLDRASSIIQHAFAIFPESFLVNVVSPCNPVIRCQGRWSFGSPMRLANLVIHNIGS